MDAKSVTESCQIADIVGHITSPGPEDATLFLEGQTNTLKTIADSCLRHAQMIDKKFEKWLMYTIELHAACVGTKSLNEEESRASSINLVVEQTRFDIQKSNVADAKAASEKLGKQLDVASDDFPTG